ncbi:rhodanese-like domain-containing protein [Desulfosediminicola sp.]|uniref:rhodanese-like domain-containing protein n=1 Tax=Desulfosediminicola sp. TaxID=2886825 RepID=UPI003AF31093
MNELDGTLREMDLQFFANGKHGVTLSQAAECLGGSGDCVFLDVRTEEEAGYVQFNNVLHIPFNLLPDRIGELPVNKTIIVFCTSVVRASMAAFYLKAEGMTGARTLMANSEEMVDLFSPAQVLSHRNSIAQQRNNCCN